MRVHQGSSFLKSLVVKANEGTMLPAAFQRPYVWTKADVLALLESIRKGYPIGSFLIWSPWGQAPLEQAARRRLGPVFPQGDAKAVSMLLDGQNRLASMCWLSYDLANGFPEDLSGVEKETWGDGTELIVDIATQEFQFVERKDEYEGLCFPVRALIGPDTNRFIRRAWDTTWAPFTEERKNEAIKFIQDCGDMFLNARVAVTEIEGASAREALDAFTHICRVGVPMSEEDLKNALAWAF